MPAVAPNGERVIRGIPVSGGVCRGKILTLGRTADAVPRRMLSDSELADNVRRLQYGLIQTRQQILEVQRKVTVGLGAEDASIFDAHLLVLEDPTLIEEVTRKILQEKVNVEYAFWESAERYA